MLHPPYVKLKSGGKLKIDVQNSDEWLLVFRPCIFPYIVIRTLLKEGKMNASKRNRKRILDA